MKHCLLLGATIALSSLGACERPQPTTVEGNASSSGTASSTVVAQDASAPSSPEPDASAAPHASAAGDASAPVADTGVIAAAPIEPPYARPCSIDVQRAAGVTDNTVRLYRVRPEGEAIELAFGPSVLRYQYDATGRVTAGPGSTYRWTGPRAAARTSGRQRTNVTFDDQQRLVGEGQGRHSYDSAGRLARSDWGRRFLEYRYAPDGTFTTNHNYPDSDEFCVADLVEVRRDARGLPVIERFDNCGINETNYTLRYEFGEGNRIDVVHVDVESNGSEDVVARFSYAAAGASCPSQ
jgi:hypothetical protein